MNVGMSCQSRGVQYKHLEGGGAHIKMVSSFRDHDCDDRVRNIFENAASIPWVQKAIGENNI